MTYRILVTGSRTWERVDLPTVRIPYPIGASRDPVG